MPQCQFDSAAPEDGFVYMACEPDFDPSVPTVDKWIAFMQGQGVERVVCLLEYSQLRDHDDLLNRYRVAFGADDVHHVPVPDNRLLELDRLSSVILPLLDASVRQERPVVIHCKAGIGRTRQALAAWLVHRHGYTPEDAVETVKQRHRRPDDTVQRGYAREKDLLRLLESVSV